MKPNPDQLKFITTGPTRRNPALYETPPEGALIEEKPTIVIGPNAAYVVDPGYWPGRLEGLPPGNGGAEAQAPVLSSLTPDTLPVWAQDTEVFWNGSGFTESSVIMWNNGQEVTKFISAEKLSTIVKPSTVQAPLPFTLETYVADGGKQTAKLTFTFIT
jgi:hypothetical protein